METKQCKKCGSIYPATDKGCPSCGSKRQNARDQKRNFMWIFPILIILLLIISVFCKEDALLGVAGLVMVVWFAVLFYRGVSKRFAPAQPADKHDRTPVAARLLQYEEKGSAKAAFRIAANGLLGYLLGGSKACAVFAAHTKIKAKEPRHLATFVVDYESGRRGSETVDVDSVRYQTLSRLAESQTQSK